MRRDSVVYLQDEWFLTKWRGIQVNIGQVFEAGERVSLARHRPLDYTLQILSDT